MITIETQLKDFFENARSLKTEQVLAWISKTQSLISQLPDTQLTSLDENKTIQVSIQIPSSLGLLRVRSISSIAENYYCVSFAHNSINYADGIAYVSSGGKKIAVWQNSEFHFRE
jgi:hypothetical protein